MGFAARTTGMKRPGTEDGRLRTKKIGSSCGRARPLDLILEVNDANIWSSIQDISNRRRN